MSKLLCVSLKPIEEHRREKFPFHLPIIQTLELMNLRASVTFFVGENGSGKSTLLEGIAAAAELPCVGADEVARDPSLQAQRELGLSLRLAWNPRSRRGFFMRAEDFFGYLKARARDEARLEREMLELYSPESAPSVSSEGYLHVDELNAASHLKRRDLRSHGESFMDLFDSRIHADGLYLLDEPEAPLSVFRQLELVNKIAKKASEGAQFIIATHSPILLALPGARIFSFDQTPIAEVAYGDLKNVKMLKAFLNDPQGVIQRGV